MEHLSTLIASLSESATLAMSQKSKEMQAQGIDVINLSLGEPDFHTPDHIKQAAKTAIDENFSFYTPVPGYLSLREAICQKLQTENNLAYRPNQIVCSNGAKQAVCNALLTVVNPEDEVIIPAPCWVSYLEMVKLTRATPVVVQTGIEHDFKMTPQQLEEAISPQTRVLMLCSPSNPTGSIYSREELLALAEVLKKHPQILVISDEIYEHINYLGSHHSMAQIAGMQERTILINGVSKAFAMTGWRLGWMAAPLWVAKAASKLQGQYTSGCSSIAQKAAEGAYQGGLACVEEMRQVFEKRRDLIVKLAAEIPGFKINRPQGAFYLFPDCSLYYGKGYAGKTIQNSYDLALYLLEEAHVACVAGAAFNAPNNIRFSYATSEALISEAMQRVKTALAKLH